MNTDLSKDEAALILDLIDLYDTAYDHNYHRRSCDCAICRTLETAGEHQTTTFESLADKAKEAKKQP